MGWNRFAVGLAYRTSRLPFSAHSLYPLVSSGKSGPEFRDFARGSSSKTIDSPRPISENEGHDRHFACPSLVHAHAPCRRGPGHGDEVSTSQRAAADSRAAVAGIAAGNRTLRVGLIAGPEATWDLAAARVAEHLRKDQDLDVYHAWDCVELGIDDPADYDCLVLLGWPAASSREQVKRIELYCRGGGSLVALRAMHAEIPGWSNFAEEVLGGRQPAGAAMPFAGSRAIRERLASSRGRGRGNDDCRGRGL